MLLTKCEFSLFSFFVICLLSLELEWKSRQTIIWSRNSKFAAWFACVNAKIKNKKHQQINQTIRNCFNVYCAQQLHKTIQTIKHATKQKNSWWNSHKPSSAKSCSPWSWSTHSTVISWLVKIKSKLFQHSKGTLPAANDQSEFIFFFFFSLFSFLFRFFSLFHGFGIILKFKIKKNPCGAPADHEADQSHYGGQALRPADEVDVLRTLCRRGGPIPDRADAWEVSTRLTHTHKSQSSRGTFLLGPPLSHFVWRSEWWISKKYARIFLSFSRS